MGYSFRLAARDFLIAPFHRQDSIYHGLCYTSRGTFARTRNLKTNHNFVIVGLSEALFTANISDWVRYQRDYDLYPTSFVSIVVD